MDIILYFICIFAFLITQIDSKSIRKQVNDQGSTYKVKFVRVDDVKDSAVPEHSRQKRSNAALMDRFLEAYNNPGLHGEVLYIARRELRLTFDLDIELVSGLKVVKSEFYLYKRIPRKMPRRLKNKDKTLPPARVVVHQTVVPHRILGETKLLDMQEISMNTTGWCVFDVTTAVNSWANDPSSNRGLEVWVESVESGKMAARVARKTKFAKTRRGDNNAVSPTLVIYYSHH